MTENQNIDPNRFVTVTEVSNDKAPLEQIQRLEERYHWAAEKCIGKDVAEFACGSGPGIGLLNNVSKSFVAGDISDDLVEHSRKVYGNRADIRVMDAMNPPFEKNSLDVIILFEALYYLPSANEFFRKCREILRPNGKLLVTSANSDLFDFNPSPYSVEYYGTTGLKKLCSESGFHCQLYGGTPVESVSLKQRVLRPVKKFAVDYNLIPNTMAAKKILKRFVFGKLHDLPTEVNMGESHLGRLRLISSNYKDLNHKVIYLEATKTD
jgi:SAM-dependent methyltransferase